MRIKTQLAEVQESLKVCQIQVTKVSKIQIAVPEVHPMRSTEYDSVIDLRIHLDLTGKLTAKAFAFETGLLADGPTSSPFQYTDKRIHDTDSQHAEI